MEEGGGLGGVEYVQCAFAADVELLGEERYDPPDLIPHE